MSNVYVIGSYMTRFQKWPDKTHRDLVREAYLEVLKDAGFPNGDLIESVWSGNSLMHHWGQQCIRGQVAFLPLIMEGLLPERVPIWNVEGGCATGSLAFQGAWRDVKCGVSQVALAIGFEKIFIPNNPKLTMAQFSEGGNTMYPLEASQSLTDLAKQLSSVYETAEDRSSAMDWYSLQAQYHMHKYGTTAQQIAMAAAKSHCNASLNPKAQYQFKMTTEEVLNDRMVCAPLTRAMCSPVGDGAAAAILCSEEFYKTLPQSIKNRAVKVAGVGMSSGKLRRPEEPSLSRVAADRAYAMAGVKPEDIDFVEVHDACSFGEIFQAEMLRLCPEGEGGKLVESGATMLDGRIPMNTSGGLVSKGHPIAATGLSMVYELTTQLRGEAGERQVKNPEFGMQENGGGGIGLEEAACSVVILQRTN